MSDTVTHPSGKILHHVATMLTTPQSNSSIKEVRIKMNPPPSLPILLARYCIVPKDMPHPLPAWAGGKHIKEVDLGPDYHYALRTLRAGYVYLFYDKNPTGTNQWECYTVNIDGSVVKQPSAEKAQAPADKVQGNTLDTHAIEIEHPDQCGTAWIAYSEHKWSKDTLDRYTADAKLRDARMQTLKVQAMATTGQHTHGSAATKESLEAIIEYSPSLDRGKLPDATFAVQQLSKEDGSFTEDILLQQSTRYPWHLRSAQAEKTVARMKVRAKRPDGSSNIPGVLALWDAIGIAHELNGFRNEAAGRIEQYGHERELELGAMNSIDGLKVALAERAGDAQKQFQDDIKKNSSYAQAQATIQQNRANAANLPEPQRRRKLEICDIQEDWARRDVPNNMGFGIRLGQADLENEPRRSQQIAAIRKDVNDFLAKREKNYHGNIADAKANAWPKYDEKLDHTALDNFRKNHKEFLSKADKLIDARTITLVKWLEAPLLLDTLEDCHPNNIADGVVFEDMVSDILFGIGATKSGAKKIDQWVKEAKASVRSNLLWRAVALNQTEGVIEIDAALKAASGSSQTLTNSAWGNVVGQVKWNKLADLYKKAQTLANTNVKAGVTPIDAGRMRAVKDVLLTAGDHLFKPFTKAIDTANEKTLQTLLLIRAGVESKAALALVKVQIDAETLDREAFVRRLANNSHYLDEAATARQTRLKEAWGALRAEADVPNKDGVMNAARDARLALVVALLEGINLWKASESAGKTPNDTNMQAQLMAARLATASAVVDVASNFVKGLATAGDRAVSYQALKVGGGALSAVATGYGAKLDWDSYEQSKNDGNFRFAILYGTRSIFQGLGATLTSFTALSYCSPLLETLGEKFSTRVIGRAAITTATRLLAARAALMLASIEVSIFVLAVSAVIWHFEDDALQKWCLRCAFGKDRIKNGYKLAGEQDKALTETLKEVL